MLSQAQSQTPSFGEPGRKSEEKTGRVKRSVLVVAVVVVVVLVVGLTGSWSEPAREESGRLGKEYVGRRGVKKDWRKRVPEPWQMSKLMECSKKGNSLGAPDFGSVEKKMANLTFIESKVIIVFQDESTVLLNLNSCGVKSYKRAPGGDIHADLRKLFQSDLAVTPDGIPCNIFCGHLGGSTLSGSWSGGGDFALCSADASNQGKRGGFNLVHNSFPNHYDFECRVGANGNEEAHGAFDCICGNDVNGGVWTGLTNQGCQQACSAAGKHAVKTGVWSPTGGDFLMCAAQDPAHNDGFRGGFNLQIPLQYKDKCVIGASGTEKHVVNKKCFCAS